MSIEKINRDDGKGFVIAFEYDEVEYVDPVVYLSEENIKKIAIQRAELFRATNPFLFKLVPHGIFVRDAKASWLDIYEKTVNTPIPPNFLTLLESKSKGEQEKLMRDQSLTASQLGALIFHSSVNFGYTFSIYRTERLPNGVDEKALPRLFKVEEGVVSKIGPTTLSDGQLKAIIAQRKVIVAKILDRKDTWHCFFQTYKSLRGEESWRGGQPHLHYISDKWGIPRADLVAQIKAGSHPSTKIHIPLVDQTVDTK